MHNIIFNQKHAIHTQISKWLIFKAVAFWSQYEL